MPKEPTYYPLTAAQNIMYLSQKFSLKKSVVDICTMIHFECEMDKNLLLQAVHVAILRCESSRVRLHKVGKEIRQYLTDQAPDPVIVMDYSDRTQEELTADLNRWSQTPFPNSSMDVQLYSIRLIMQPDGFYGMYFCVSHLAFDAYALMSIASDMLNIYVALRDGLPIPKVKSDYLRLCETDWEYQKSDRKAKDAKFWTEDIYTDIIGPDHNHEPLFTSIEPTKLASKPGTRYAKTVSLLNSKACHYNYKIEADLAKKVTELALSYKIPPQCFYLLALRSYLSKMNNNAEDVTIMNTMARRAKLLEKRSGGTRVLAIAFRSIIPQTATVKEGLEKLALLQKKYYSHSDMLLTEIMNAQSAKFKNPAMTGYASLSLTFNPYYVSLPEGIEARMSTFSNGANTMPIYLSIMALDNSGELNCNYDCMVKFTTPETAGKIHAHLIKALGAIVANPEMTITLQDLTNL